MSITFRHMYMVIKQTISSSIQFSTLYMENKTEVENTPSYLMQHFQTRNS